MLIYLFFCGVAVRENGWGGDSERVHSGIFIHGVSHSPNTKECIAELQRARYNNDCRWEDHDVPSCHLCTVPASLSHHLATRNPESRTAMLCSEVPRHFRPKDNGITNRDLHSCSKIIQLRVHKTVKYVRKIRTVH